MRFSGMSGERYEQAENHFAAAEIDERCGAPLVLAHSGVALGGVLIAGGRSEDLDRSKQTLAQTEETAERLGRAWSPGKSRIAARPSRRLAGSRTAPHWCLRLECARVDEHHSRWWIGRFSVVRRVDRRTAALLLLSRERRRPNRC
jgi:hypothetical protein